jgi:NAD(P)-dependent dehydrogenase (short-subunit alcohol dehydrogenase family)
MAVELDGAVVIVTGGANGIGAAAARRLASRGAHVVVADVDERGADVAAEVGGLFVYCDVREPAASEAAVSAAVAAFGGLDVAFLNAGVSTTSVRLGGPGWDLAAYRRAFAINVDGVFFGVHAALPALRDRGSGT